MPVRTCPVPGEGKRLAYVPIQTQICQLYKANTPIPGTGSGAQCGPRMDIQDMSVQPDKQSDLSAFACRIIPTLPLIQSIVGSGNDINRLATYRSVALPHEISVRSERIERSNPSVQVASPERPRSMHAVNIRQARATKANRTACGLSKRAHSAIGGMQESRATRCGVTAVVTVDVAPSWASSSAAAWRPTSRTGRRMVLSAGHNCEASGLSS